VYTFPESVDRLDDGAQSGCYASGPPIPGGNGALCFTSEKIKGINSELPIFIFTLEIMDGPDNPGIKRWDATYSILFDESIANSDNFPSPCELFLSYTNVAWSLLTPVDCVC
jgi:hypothetical protein